MRTFLTRLSFHIIVLALTVGCIEYYLIKVNPYKYDKYSYDELFNGKSRDNIIIGASHATHGINPKYIASADFYNFALNGANPSFTLKWYKNFLSSRHKPRFIIYEVNWFIFDSNWLWRRLEQDSRYLPKAVFFDLLTNDQINKVELISNVLFICQGGDLYKKIMYPEQLVDYSTRHNGFIALNYNRLAYREVNFKYDISRYNDFIELIKLITGSGTELVFIQAPEYLPGRDSSEAVKQNATLRNIADTYHIPFINYNDERVSGFNYNKAYFADWGHLSKEGSTRFSNILDNDLKTIRK